MYWNIATYSTCIFKFCWLPVSKMFSVELVFAPRPILQSKGFADTLEIVRNVAVIEWLSSCFPAKNEGWEKHCGLVLTPFIPPTARVPLTQNSLLNILNWKWLKAVYHLLETSLRIQMWNQWWHSVKIMPLAMLKEEE